MRLLGTAPPRHGRASPQLCPSILKPLGRPPPSPLSALTRCRVSALLAAVHLGRLATSLSLALTKPATPACTHQRHGKPNVEPFGLATAARTTNAYALRAHMCTPATSRAPGTRSPRPALAHPRGLATADPRRLSLCSCPPPPFPMHLTPPVPALPCFFLCISCSEQKESPPRSPSTGHHRRALWPPACQFATPPCHGLEPEARVRTRAKP